MKPLEKNFQKVERALKSAYRDYDAESMNNLADDLWREKVMNHIRRIGPLKSEASCVDLFDRFFWHFVPVAAILILVLAVFLYNSGNSSEVELVKLFMENPAGFVFTQAIGI